MVDKKVDCPTTNTGIASAMMALEICLLGDFLLRDDTGTNIPLGGEKATLLFALLARSPDKKCRRRKLLGSLWPEAEERNAQGNLRFLVHRIRQLLPVRFKDILKSDRSTIWLDPAQTEVDVDRFEALVQEGTREALAAADGLYRGDFLANLNRVATACEDWLLSERARLCELEREVLQQLFALSVWRGDVAAAKQVAERSLVFDPYWEAMQAAVIRLHLSQGQRAFAAARAREWGDRLARDLQVGTGDEIRRLEPLLESRRPTPASFHPAWVLGREDAPLHDGKPLVAVRIFRDLSDDRQMATLPIAMAEDVIAHLSRFRRLAVLAWETSLGLAANGPANEELRRLGTRYVVDGSVRRTGTRLQVAVSLADNLSRRQIWAEHYRGDMEGLPGFQEDVARAIASAIPVEVELAELARIRQMEFVSMTAYELYLRGRHHQRAGDPASHARAFECFAKALERDDNFAAAHAEIALAIFCGGNGFGHKLDHRLVPAFKHAQRAIELDPLDPRGHWTMAMLMQLRREFSAARPYLDRANTLSPGDAETLAYTALEMAFAGEADQAVERARHSMRLNPYHPPAYMEIMGKSCFMARRYEDALMWLRQYPDRVVTNRGFLAAAAAYAGRTAEARQHAQILADQLCMSMGADAVRARGGPIGILSVGGRFRNEDDAAHYRTGLLMAGLPS